MLASGALNVLIILAFTLEFTAFPSSASSPCASDVKNKVFSRVESYKAANRKSENLASL